MPFQLPSRFFAVALSTAMSASLIPASTLLAQDMSSAPAQSAPSGQPMQHGPMSPDMELQHLTKALQLTSDQQSQIKPILQDRHDQMMQIHQDSSLARPDKMAKMKSLDDDSNTKLEAVLNDQQKAKYEKMMQHRREKMQQMRGMQQGGGDSSSPQPQQ